MVCAAFDPTSPVAEACTAFLTIALVLVVCEYYLKKSGLPQNRGNSAWQADDALLNFSKWDKFTVRDACEGVLILGATGSGKTSGSGRALADGLLRAGCGGLVLTVKREERELWDSYCRRAGRSRDLVIFDRSKRWRFNFMDYEAKRAGVGAGLTENMVDLLTICLDIARRGGSQKGDGREDGRFWEDTFKQLCRNGIDLLTLGAGKISIPDLYRVVTSTPTTLAESESSKWMESSECFRWLLEAERRGVSKDGQEDFTNLQRFFLRQIPALSDKTRSTIEATFTSMIDVLNRGLGKELLCTDTTFTPEMIENGAVVVLDLPILEYGLVGRLVQGILKYSFQRAIERRKFIHGQRPVFLFADEFQHFVNLHDMLFQGTCRSAGVATVYLSQNVNTIYAMLGGGEAGKGIAHSIFGNLGTKIFHSNSCIETNEWASSMIGRSRQFLTTSSTSQQTGDWFSELSGMGTAGQISAGVNEHIDFEVQQRRFTTLRKGGPGNRWEVDGIVVQSGQRFRKTGKTWLPVTFQQR